MEDFPQICRSMPKVELHAHLNGSISDKIMDEVAFNWNIGGQGDTKASISKSDEGIRTLEDCWKAFARIHSLVTTTSILEYVTKRVIEEFDKENVIYLEMRTTPKKIHKIQSKEDYLACVIGAIKSCKDILKITVKLLISVDRKMGEQEGVENVDLAIKWAKLHPDIVVGVDISGNPTEGKTEWIMRLLEKTRKAGLPISCHLPEVINLEESREFLKFRPERVAHSLFLHPSCGGTDELWDLAKRYKIPIEVCISSNVVSGITKSIEEHYVKLLHAEEMPYVICTDDSGVFQTSLTSEFLKLREVIATLDKKDLEKICLQSVHYSFASEQEKENMTNAIKTWWGTMSEQK